MKPGFSKKKGNRGEREIAVILTAMTGVSWKRVPCSGAMFTAHTEDDFKGDVYSKDPYYEDIVIEVKNYKEPVMITELFNPKSKLHRWIGQLKNESTMIGVLFFKVKGKWCWYYYHNSQIDLKSRFKCILKDHSVTYHDYGMIVK